MSKWQPIETAPEDTPVLVGDPIDRLAAYPSVYIASSWDWDIATKYGQGHTWYRLLGQDGYVCHPTHWMPLPEPPQ